MAISSTVVNKELRDRIFNDLNSGGTLTIPIDKINDRQYGCILIDLNGVERYCRIGVIVAEERNDMTARALMQSEIDKYQESVAKKEEANRKKAEKAQKDKEERERKAKEKGE